MLFNASVVLGLLAASASASVCKKSNCNRDNCFRAVVMSSVAPGPSKGSADCSSFMRKTVVPCASTVTTTVTTTATAAPVTQINTAFATSVELDTVVSVATVTSTSVNVATTLLESDVTAFTTVTAVTTLTQTVTTTVNAPQKRAVSTSPALSIAPQASSTCAATTYAPSVVPNYASACSGTARYSSACSCNGIAQATTTATASTVTTTTTTTVSTTPTVTATITNAVLITQTTVVASTAILAQIVTSLSTVTTTVTKTMTVTQAATVLETSVATVTAAASKPPGTPAKGPFAIFDDASGLILQPSGTINLVDSGYTNTYFAIGSDGSLRNYYTNIDAYVALTGHDPILVGNPAGSSLGVDAAHKVYCSITNPGNSQGDMRCVANYGSASPQTVLELCNSQLFLSTALTSGCQSVNLNAETI